MLGKIYWNTADFEKDDSLALKLRLKRIELFKSLIRNMNRPVKILDVGGTELFWKRMELKEDLNITILNIIEEESYPEEYEYLEGDGRDMHMFPDKSFDLVFSNSVIEHAGSLDDQEKMAQEIRRVSKRYFIQTPHYYSPVEPHFFFPLFQFLPVSVKAFLLQHFNLGYLEKTPDKKEALEVVNSIRLLKKKELRKFFPDATIKTENLYGFPVSYIIYK